MSVPLAAQASARVRVVMALVGPVGAWAKAKPGLNASAAKPAAIIVASRMKASLVGSCRGIAVRPGIGTACLAWRHGRPLTPADATRAPLQDQRPSPIT